MNVVMKKKKRLTGTSLEIVTSGLQKCRNAPFPAQKMRNDIEQLTIEEIAEKYGVEPASKSYNYKPTIVSYLDACIAETNQANAAAAPPVAPPVAPQNNVNLVDVDVDATLAAAGTGDEHTAGEVISSRHHPGGHADENSMPDVVSLSQLQGVLRKQQMEFQQEMQQQNEEFQQQFAAALGGISAGNE